MRRQAGRERQPEIERSGQGNTAEAYLNTPQAAKREATTDEEGIKKSIWETPQATETTQQPPLNTPQAAKREATTDEEGI